MHPRIPRELHERLAAYAERSHRNLTNAVIHLLTAALDREEETD
jgi:predicted HicB family RNase H-like nuclease